MSSTTRTIDTTKKLNNGRYRKMFEEEINS